MSEPEYEIDVTIEAVTGTVYDLCVSPFETILGIKTKIEQLEGIPVYQQHLVYGHTELIDDYCLEEYGIRSGCQLKLVIAMRGGPIHAHRIHLEDSSLWELAQYLENQSPDQPEQLTVMFLSDDNVDGDGRSQLQSPVGAVSESRLSGSQASLVTTTQPKVMSSLQNTMTHDKMREIQTRLRKLRLNRQEHTVLPTYVQRPKMSSEHSSKFNIHSGCSPNPTTPPKPLTHTCTASLHHCTCSCTQHCHKCYAARIQTQRRLVFTPQNNDIRNGCNEKGVTKTSSKDTKMCERQPSSQLRQRKKQRINSNDISLEEGCSHSSLRLSSVTRQKPLYQFTSTSRSHFLPPINDKISSGRLKQSLSANRDDTSIQCLPPLVNKVKGKCMKCNKRTRLATSFTCRCGGVYCSTHRYAESHSCTFNYKAEGRKCLARSNPLVTATKLPKI